MGVFMKKKLLCCAISIAMIVSTSSVTFAAESVNEEQIIAEHKADVVEEIVGTETVCADLEESNTAFLMDSEEIVITVPKEGDGEIVLDIEGGEAIGMSLPEEAENAKGVITDEGTIIYDIGEDVNIAVQVLSEEKGDMGFEAVRTMLTIENSSAPTEYAFSFNMPKGYTLVKDTEYSDEFDEYDCGDVYVLDENGVIINTIDAAWAKDANGNDVDTHYEIKENTLIQIISFDDNSAFPIIADPTSHPTKYTHYYTNYYELKKVVEKGYNTCQTLGVSIPLYIASLVKTLSPGASVVSGMLIVADVWSYYQFSKVKEKFYSMNKSQWLKTTYTHTWRNGGKNSGYVRSSSPTLKIVSKKGA